jgi:hypothetical protein
VTVLTALALEIDGRQRLPLVTTTVHFCASNEPILTGDSFYKNKKNAKLMIVVGQLIVLIKKFFLKYI